MFLNYGLMEYGTVFGHGAYLGPDFTADYLRRAARFVSAPTAAPAPTGRARSTSTDFQVNRYDEAPDARAARRPRSGAHRGLDAALLATSSAEPTTQNGLRPDAIADPRAASATDRLLRLDGLDGAAERPGKTTRTRTTGRPSRAVGQQA